MILVSGLTGMVPAAPCSASSSPATFKYCGGPETGGVLAESIWGQITYLQPGELTQEIPKRHPNRSTDVLSSSFFMSTVTRTSSKNLPELSVLHLTQKLVLLRRVDSTPLFGTATPPPPQWSIITSSITTH